MSDAYPWKRAREFKPAGWTHHLATGTEGPALCGATFPLEAEPTWNRVTCPRCHADRIADIGFTAHMTETYPDSPRVAAIVTDTLQPLHPKMTRDWDAPDADPLADVRDALHGPLDDDA